MKKFNVGVIGLGQRGGWWVENMLVSLPQVKITALCDRYSDRVQARAEAIKEKTGEAVALLTTDYRELIDSPLVDTVLVFTSWDMHIDISCYALECGKPVASEVGGAYSINECFRLVSTCERTKTPFMMLENCCYGEIEMTVTNMARTGILGRIMHCEGGYRHDLRDEIAGGVENRHYRLEEYLHRNCDNYPTHELGPIAKLLDINNGNRFLSLVSVASAAAGMNEYLKNRDGGTGRSFNQGDVITTVIRCTGGETIRLTLDTTLPRYYSRDFSVHGTKGMYEECTNSLFLDGDDRSREFDWTGDWGNMKKYMDAYRHPLWREYRDGGIRGGHGGMDFLVISAFFDALENGTPMPVDVYDAAAWMSVTALSEQSVALNGAPVYCPDFTNGKWKYRKPPQNSRFNLL